MGWMPMFSCPFVFRIKHVQAALSFHGGCVVLGVSSAELRVEGVNRAAPGTSRGQKKWGNLVFNGSVTPLVTVCCIKRVHHVCGLDQELFAGF